MEKTYREMVQERDASIAEMRATVRGKTSDRVRLLENVAASYREDIEHLLDRVVHLTRMVTLLECSKDTLQETNDMMAGMVRMYAPPGETEISEPTKH